MYKVFFIVERNICNAIAEISIIPIITINGKFGGDLILSELTIFKQAFQL